MSNFRQAGRKVSPVISRARCTQADLPEIVAIGRNYADHAKELGNAVPKGKSVSRQVSTSQTSRADSEQSPSSS